MLSFLIPSATARAAAMVPIMLGIVAAFGADRRSRFASLLMITTAQGISVWNVGVKTAAAQNMIAIGFIQKMLGHDITWLQLAGRGGAVFHRAVDRALCGDDGDAAAGGRHRAGR